MTKEEVVRLFHKERNENYEKIIGDCQDLLEDLNKTPKEEIPKKLEQAGDTLKNLCKRTAEIEDIDYFRADKWNETNKVLDEVKRKLEDLKVRYFDRYMSQLPQRNADKLRGKKWVTRKRPHIDRVASAWLIKRFIDEEAVFDFVSETGSSKNAISFDIVGAELSHHGEDCTFETILKRFAIKDRILSEIAEIVHDIDLKDEKFGRQEARGLDVIIRGLAEILKDDHGMLEKGGLLLDAVYTSLGGKIDRDG
jgi:hypothetical protein